MCRSLTGGTGDRRKEGWGHALWRTRAKEKEKKEVGKKMQAEERCGPGEMTHWLRLKQCTITKDMSLIQKHRVAHNRL